MLVIDDIGTEVQTPSWQQVLDDVLDARWQCSLATVLTSNLSAENFKTRYGERIADRIRDDGCVASLSGQSMRAPGKRNNKTNAP
jgi:DNA replication protein DnaC